MFAERTAGLLQVLAPREGGLVPEQPPCLADAEQRLELADLAARPANPATDSERAARAVAIGTLRQAAQKGGPFADDLAMLQVLGSDYVRTARAKGLDERTVILKHALRNALTPVITLGALGFGELLGGTVLTESVFSIPGFGKLIVDAVFNRDYAVVQGVVLVTATVYITLNLLADLAYFVVNPRMRG